MQLLADLHAGGDAEFAAEAVTLLGDSGGGRGFQALEIPVQHEVDDAAHRVGAVLRGGAAGDDVDRLDQAGWKHPDIHRAAAVVLDDTGAVQQHQGPLALQAAKIEVSATGVAEQRAAAALGRLGLEELRQLIQLVGDRSAGVQCRQIRQ